MKCIIFNYTKYDISFFFKYIYNIYKILKILYIYR